MGTVHKRICGDTSVAGLILFLLYNGNPSANPSNPGRRAQGEKDSAQERGGEGKEKNKVRTTSGFGHGT